VEPPEQLNNLQPGPQPPQQNTTVATPEVKPTKFNFMSFMFFVLLIAGLLSSTTMSLLAFPILIFGSLAAADLFKESAKTSKGASAAVKAFKTIAIVGLSLVILSVASIAVLMIAGGGGIG
jgi:hypothetical protein